MRKFLLVLCLSVLLPFVASAQTNREVQKSVKVYFRQGAVTIDESYMDNAATLREFAKEVEAYSSDSTMSFRRIHVMSSVSPEGGVAVNERIAKQRAEAIAKWVSKRIGKDVGYDVESMGIDWPLLVELIQEAGNKVPYCDEVLDLLCNSGEEISIGDIREDVRYTKLTKLRGGEPYRWIYKNLFPKLRYASARCEFWWEVMPELLVPTDPQRFGAAGGNGEISYTKNIDDDVVPAVLAQDGWVEVIEATEDGVAFAVAKNPSTEPRQTNLVVSCYGKDHVVPVIQEGAVPGLTITSATTVNYPAEGATDSITFEKSVADDVTPVVSCSSDWIESIVPTSEGITYVVAKNPSTEPRSTTITVESYGSKHDVIVNQVGAVSECKPFYMGIKTNMLYDLFAVPNIGAEFYLGKNISIAANYAHAWWQKPENSFYWRYYGADASIRWWFGKPARIKPLQGHHLGINYQILTYDFQLGKTGIMAGMPSGTLVDRANHIVALEYGYSLPIAKRLNLDFTIAGGYHWGLFEEYNNIDGHPVWQATKRRRYLGPTKLEISLVWLIGCDNYNKDK